MTSKIQELQDWLEFKCCNYVEMISSNWHYVNLKRSEISEVCQFDARKHNSSDECEIVMKNGNKYVVMCPYEKVMEMV